MNVLEGLDPFIEQLLDQWHVPGFAVGVIQDQEIILSKGYGYSDLNAKKPVTLQTLFGLASVTKSFVTTGAAMLVDQGKLAWDTPIREYIPEFKLSDQVATEKTKLRDLLTHRTGLPRHDGLWANTGLTREEIIDRLQYLDFNADFRQKWQYNNLMYLLAGYLIERASGSSWESFTRKHILTPLGMRGTKYTNQIDKVSNLARPYHYYQGRHKLIRFQWDSQNACEPAGGIYSNVSDMLKYLNFHLNHGEHQGQRLLSQKNCRELHSHQVVISDGSNYEEIGPASTCMGFETSTYRGQRYVYHGGSNIGFICRLSFMPDKNIGLILLSNLNGFDGENPVPWIVARNLEDRLLGLDQIDWNARLTKDRKRVVAMSQDAKKHEGKETRKGTKPSHTLCDYLGDYEHPAYGLIRIKPAKKNSGSMFAWEFNGHQSTLNHVHFDTFASPKVPYVIDSLSWAKLTFHTNKHGDIDCISTVMETEVDDVMFNRIAEPSLCTRKSLKKFVGHYRFQGGVAQASLSRSGKLMWATPFNETFELIPFITNKFKIKGLPNGRLEFKTDQSGKVRRVLYVGNSLTFEARKIKK